MDSVLPVDAVSLIFRSLDWRSVCSCACVCSSWHDLAADNSVWHNHITQEYFRPSLLAYSAAHLAVGWKDTAETQYAATTAAVDSCHVAAHASLSKGSRPVKEGHAGSIQQQQQAAAIAGAMALSTSNAPGVLKSLFSAGMLHAAAPHQAQLARFHAALSCITGWRLVLTVNATSAPAQPVASSTAASRFSMDAAAFASLSLSHKPAATSSSSAAPAQASAQAGFQGSRSAGTAASSSRDHTMQANTAAGDAGGDSAAPPGSSAVKNINSRQRPVCGDPAPLTLQALQCGGWACGCVMMQQQEQSCWVRFNLPAQLKTDQEVAKALEAGNITAVVQGLGPPGWFDAATAAKFELSDNDVEILMQSHKTGFYAWDQLEEEGVDRYGQLNPLPWDLNPGQHQQQDQQHLPHQSKQQPDQQQQQQQQQQLPDGDQAQEADAAAPAPQLRMLVYVHYEQLLQTLPWEVPHILPLPARPVFHTHKDVARHLLASPAPLWLQLDVCRLHGGYRLGTCMVPLALSDWDLARAKFRCIEDQLLVVLYRPDSSTNSTKGVSGQPAGLAAEAGEQEAATDHTAGSLPAVGDTGSRSAVAAAAAGGVMIRPRTDIGLGQDACQQVLLGDKCLSGGGSSSSSSSSQDGSILLNAADALQELMVTDEIMVDFAVFDHNGHLLMGRAGVEVWSKENTEPGYIQQQAPQPVPHGMSASSSADTQPKQEVQGSSASAGDGGHQLAQPTAQARLESLIVRILANGPLQYKARGAGMKPSMLELLTARERARIESVLDEEDVRAQQEQELSAAAAVQHARTQQRLHFLVDGCWDFFWDTCIVVDTPRPPTGFVRYARGPVSTVSMNLLWANVRALFGLAPFAP